MYNEDQVREATLDYFDGDELATNVFICVTYTISSD